MFGQALALTLLFAFTNGIHDASNAIAALVATRGARPLQAVVLAASIRGLDEAIERLEPRAVGWARPRSRSSSACSTPSRRRPDSRRRAELPRSLAWFARWRHAARCGTVGAVNLAQEWRTALEELVDRAFGPFDAVFDVLEQSGAAMRQQAEALSESVRALEQAADLMRGQAELFERTVHTVRQPAEMAKGVARLGGHTRRR
jgi:hypothetical protein